MDATFEEALLSSAANELSQRGLRVGARWALELIGGLAADGDAAVPASVGPVPPHLCAPSAPFPPQDESVFQLARLYLDNREFARAAHLLDRHFAPDGAAPSAHAFPPRAFFLRCYALFLVRGRGGCWRRGWAPQKSLHPAHTPPAPHPLPARTKRHHPPRAAGRGAAPRDAAR